MSLLDHTPRFNPEDAIHIAQELYGLDATATMLPSERDQNFLMHTPSGERFVLKIANATETRAMLEAQQQAMARVAGVAPVCQSVALTPRGAGIAEVQSADVRHFVWLVTYLPGVPLGSVSRHSPELLFDLGRRIGQLDRALEGFDHEALHRDFHWDLASGLRIVREYEPLVADEEMRRLIGRIAADFERHVAPLLPALRHSVIHNDANDYNVLVGGGDDLYTRNQRVTGVIDFGDMVHSFTVGDLAVAIAYTILDKPDPFAAAAQIVKGYHAEYALNEDEIAALFGLVCLRLCMSVCLAAHQQRQRPDDEYLAISQQPIRRTLPKLAQIPRRLAEATFRHACGLAPVKSGEAVTGWLRASAQAFAQVLDIDLRAEPCVVFDLSVGSPTISGDERENAEPRLTERLFGLMKEAGVKVGVGRYDEPRLLYTTPAFTAGSPFDEHRTIHLGIDLFAEAGTPVHAPLAGVAHAFNNNAASLDYGPMIILRHETGDGHEFYTLYGHLSEQSLEGLSAGRPVARGERIATIGTPPANGDWTPHLHFQIITDLLDLGCDFPGVGRAGQRELWRSLSPDPNLILGIPADRFPPPEPDKAETLAVRRERIGRNLSIAYRDPVKIVRGWMQYLFDENGRRYLDAYNNVPHVGHCHPRVVEAGRRQMTVLNTNTRYLHDLINRYAERLCATLPGHLSICFFVNSASEANELALRLARAHTRRRDLIVLEAAYHGHTTTLVDISPYKHDGPGGEGAPPWVHTAPIPDVYRGPYKRDDPQAGEKYAHHVLEIIERLRERGLAPAGYIAETCPSVGGQIFFPEGYLVSIYRHVREAGGICIADEVQTGYGRTGTHFWAFEAQGVVPDIVVMGKPIGNGHPIGAVVTTPEIAASFDNGMEFFSTFGGNTVSCAIGLAVLDVMRDERLQERAFGVGGRLLAGLRPLIERYPIVGDVRGSGLFLGIELVRDRETLAPAAEEASFVANRMREYGILLGTDGPFHNVVKIRPPMQFAESDADFLVAAMDRILAEDFGA
ncbi:MAG TPA: aminotransferase class III-fold pyridoxal phosphate-dependent enzyme [Blastocatellia bacterium]|nr:aminotransferase class III-fold pyridoxal phosphate-dependent enzyme [Blastocatellia bacterium]